MQLMSVSLQLRSPLLEMQFWKHCGRFDMNCALTSGTRRRERIAEVKKAFILRGVGRVCPGVNPAAVVI